MSAGHGQRVRLLYKTILKLHRGLPEELQLIGNSYTRDEFKRHKKCNPAETSTFMIEWTKYAITLSEQLGLRGPKDALGVGDNLGEDALENLSEEQLHQLHELLMAATAPRNRNDL